MKAVYLDNAATTMIKPPAVIKAVAGAMKNLASPGRGGYREAMKAAEVVFECRERAAALFGVDNPENVVFTMNATHGLNIAIKSLVHRGDRVVVSGYEHNAVMRPLTAIGADIAVARSELFDREGTIRAFERAVDDSTKAVICNHVSNVFGFELPIYEIAGLCADRGVPLIVDASQSAGSRDVDMGSLKAAFIAMPGHKGLYGPQGTGLLLCGHQAKTLIEGGTGSESKLLKMPDFLPDRLEAGTHNVPGVAGLNEGLKYVEKHTVHGIYQHESALIARAVDGLKGNPNLQLFAAPGAGAALFSFRLRGRDSEETATLLAGEGVAVRAGLHCAPEAHRSAGTLETGTVRVSVSSLTSPRDIDIFLGIVNNF